MAWEIVERLDTWNIKSDRRCIARVQKKAGAREEAQRIIDCVNALEGIEDPEQALEMFRKAWPAFYADMLAIVEVTTQRDALLEALKRAAAAMDDTRKILQERARRDQGYDDIEIQKYANWGVLDTASARATIAQCEEK